jgi:hypothetical protein
MGRKLGKEPREKFGSEVPDTIVLFFLQANEQGRQTRLVGVLRGALELRIGEKVSS